MINPTPYMGDTKKPLSDSMPRLKPARKLTVLVDADSLVYLAGFSVQRKVFNAVDDEGFVISSYKKAKDIPVSLDYYALEETIEVEPFLKAEFILRKKRLAIKELTKYAKQEWFLTKGSGLWRNEYARLDEYKGNRKASEKPIYYNECRDLMLDHFGAKIIHGIEADDIVAEKGRNNVGGTIICSADKDLRTVAGYHMNPNKADKVVTVTPRQACLNFYVQMLMGDRIDNIRGLSGVRGKRGIGAKTALKLLGNLDTEQDMIDLVMEKYSDKYDVPFLGWTGQQMSWQEIMVETANLLYLREDRKQEFCWRQ